MAVIIDRRPLWVILITKGFRPLFFLFLALSFWYLVSATPPEGLTREGLRAITIFLVTLMLWVTHALPLAITSIFAMVAVPLAGVLEAKETYSLFGNEAVFFILGAFILAAAVMHSGLSSRIAFKILERFGRTPSRLLLSIFLLSAFLSFFISEHAVAAMLFPIALEIAKALDLKPARSNYGKLLFLSLAWGCIIGGVATFLGGARVPLASGILKEIAGEGIDFLGYTVAVVPTVVIMLFIAFYILRRTFPIDIESIDGATVVLSKKKKTIGKMGYTEYLTGSILILTVLMWASMGNSLGLANIALGSVVLLFVFRLVRWKDVEEYVNWGIILMYGGAITLGTALERSGAVEWFVKSTISHWTIGAWSLISLLSLLSLLLTEGMSNAAVIAVLMPLAIGLAREFNIDPKAVTYAIAVPAGLAFSLPMATPANAIVVSSGYLKVRDMVRAGVLVSLSAWIVFNLMTRLYWPLIGIHVGP